MPFGLLGHAKTSFVASARMAALSEQAQFFTSVKLLGLSGECLSQATLGREGPG